MKVINPIAFLINDFLSGLSVCQQIDYCASTCYQRPVKPTEAEAATFCKKFGIEAGHRPMLEFAVIHLVMDQTLAESLECEKYLMVDQISDDEGCVSGSIRAWMEAKSPIADFIRGEFLAYFYPVFFGEPADDRTGLVRFAKKDEIPINHVHMVARFIISRAISHELVRHRPVGILQESQRYCRYEDDVTFIRPLWAEGSYMYALFHGQCLDCEAAYKERLSAKMSPQMARGVLNNDCKTEVKVIANLPEWDHIFNMRCSAGADPEMRRVMIPLRAIAHAKYPEFEWSHQDGV